MRIRGGIGSVLLCAAVATAAAPAGAATTLFRPYTATPTGSWPEAVAIGDVTGDGRADVVMTTSYYFDAANDYKLFVFRQQSDGTLAVPVKYTLGANVTRGSVAIGDISGDGRKDVVVALGSSIGVFAQNSGGTLDAPMLTPTTKVEQIRIGRLNNDSLLDVVGIGWGGNTVNVFLNRAGALGAPTTYNAQHAGYDDLEVADVTGDSRDDVIVMSGQGHVPNLSVVPQLAIGGFGAAVEYSLPGGVLSHGVGVGDVTGDGKTDVVLSYGGNKPASKIAVFAQQAGALAAPVIYDSYDIPEPVEVADVNNDGRADVVTAHGGWNALGVYTQQSNGTLAVEERYALPYASHYNAHGLAIGDINNDGAKDVVLADYNHGLVVLSSANPTPPPPPPADIALTTEGPSKAVRIAKPYTFTVKVKNNGPNSALAKLNATVTGPTSAVVVNDARCSAVGGLVSCAFATIAPGQTLSIQISGTTTAKGTIALAAASNGPAPDPVPANNTATRSFKVKR